MTARGLCLLLPALAGTATGLLINHASLSILSLAVVLWMMAEWAVFQLRQLRELPSIEVHRSVNGRTNATGVCFAGRRLRMSVTVRRHRGSLRPWTRIRDLVPDILSVSDGNPVQLVTRSESHITFQYDCYPRAAGAATIPGCRVRIQDPNGFFVSDRFVAARQSLKVLPSYDGKADPQPQIKRLNGLPQHGIHRLQRAGMGSELLELREYVPGDPPKSIAWKVSARRDKLMTREYESEVPVRTIVFMDASSRTRRGQWGSRLCDASSRLAGSVARTALTAGDPAGLVLFSERDVRRLTPGWGERTLFRILEKLADSCRSEAGTALWSVDLQNQAVQVCQDRYPELLDDRFNAVPWTVFPLLPSSRRTFRTRSMLAGVLCQIHQLSPSDWARLIYNDEFMGQHLCRFLNAEGQSAGTQPSTAAPQEDALNQLARALRQAVGQARDNEHYIIICDLLDAEHLLEIIRPVIQLARARHHRLALICPMPQHQAVSGNGNDPPTASLLLHEAWEIEQQESQTRLTRELRSLGVPVTFADRDRPIAVTLAELSLTRRARATTGVR